MIVTDDARADIRASGFWTKGEDALFDVKIFNPQANSYRSKPLILVYKQQECLNKLRYEERVINVQHGSRPLYFQQQDELASRLLCLTFLKRLAGMATDRRGVHYTRIMAWLRCRASFSLVRSSIMCLLGSWSSRHRGINLNMEVASCEARIST